MQSPAGPDQHPGWVERPSWSLNRCQSITSKLKTKFWRLKIVNSIYSWFLTWSRSFVFLRSRKRRRNLRCPSCIFFLRYPPGILIDSRQQLRSSSRVKIYFLQSLHGTWPSLTITKVCMCVCLSVSTHSYVQKVNLRCFTINRSSAMYLKISLTP